MATKNDFIDLWSSTTGRPEKEVRQRVRALFDAGLLPGRAAGDQNFTHEHLTNAVLGMLGAEQHLDAAEAVRALAACRCYAPAKQCPDPYGLNGCTAQQAISLAWNPPFHLLLLQTSTTYRTVELVMARDVVLSATNPTGLESAGLPVRYKFLAADSREPLPPGSKFKVDVLREITFPLLAKLAALAPRLTPERDAA